MKQAVFAAVLTLAAAGLASAHFPFLVPDEDGSSARFFLSETLEPDARVDVRLVGESKLSLRDAHGRETPLSLVRAGGVFAVALPGAGARLVHGLTDLGVMSRGKTHVLLYYPKTLLGDPFDSKVGAEAVVELIPVGRAGALALELVARGKPLANAEITVLLPDGTEKAVETDANGRTETFAQEGRYGAWARFWEDVPGEREGQRYEQVRHYATLVFDTRGFALRADSSAVPTATKFATLPQATSSFGAASSDGWLYVYGGHVSPTHVYSTEAVSGRFDRMRLTGEPVWEELPSGAALQGMNLAAHGGFLYLAGGMAPHNKPGEPADNRSVADCARFDPAARRWEPLPPLPEPRSSHDLLVVGDKLVVIGGWTMAGTSGVEWLDTFLVMDLASKKRKWQALEAPFQRRALMAAAYQGKMYVVGGFNDENEIVKAVSIYDFDERAWTEGPNLPDGGRSVGFAPAVGVHDERLYASVSDGALWRLAKSGQAWEKAGDGTPRVAHRIVSRGNAVLALGGAADGKNLDLVEALLGNPLD